MSRLDILKSSLEKKEAKFREKLDAHISDVNRADGQPVNDKRNGRTTLSRWERQNASLRAMDEDIERTKEAIGDEENKQKVITRVKDGMPKIITDLIEDGTLKQWGKYPNIMFVEGVDKARIIWDAKKQKVMHKFYSSVTDPEQRRKFAGVYNLLHHEINELKN